MTATGRVVAVIVGFVGLLFAAADLVREAVLANERSLEWPFADWWSQLTTDSTWATAVAAAAVAVVAVALIVLGVRQLRPARRAGGQVELGDEAGRARLDLPAIEKTLRRRLEKDLPGVKTRALELTNRGDGWWVRVEAELPARDVLGVQARAVGLLQADLVRMGGLRLDGLNVVATRLT
ncbi:MAG: hypothetical protein NTW58_05005 [Actinobacteria bacterium]|nr:hypothetical protein [Actinomycetota bacterium]